MMDNVCKWIMQVGRAARCMLVLRVRGCTRVHADLGPVVASRTAHTHPRAHPPRPPAAPAPPRVPTSHAPTCTPLTRPQDWEGIRVSLFENHQDCWVVRVDASSVDSLDGLAAYMNVFVRCNEQINGYGLTKVRAHGGGERLARVAAAASRQSAKASCLGAPRRPPAPTHARPPGCDAPRAGSGVLEHAARRRPRVLCAAAAVGAQRQAAPLLPAQPGGARLAHQLRGAGARVAGAGGARA